MEGLPRKKEKTLEDYRRQLSRIILESVERHNRHVRTGEARRTDSPFSLLFRLTAKNASGLEVLLNKEPLFFEQHPEVPPIVLLDEAIRPYFPKEFFNDPTSWIEQQPNIERGAGAIPVVANLGSLMMDVPYDVTNVKNFTLNNSEGGRLPVVSKRIDRRALKSVNRQREAAEVGIPTPQVYGEVIHGENQYALFEEVQGVTILDATARVFGDSDKYYRLLEAPTYIDESMWDFFFTDLIKEDTPLQEQCKALWRQHQEAIQYHFFSSKISLYILDVIEGQRDYLRHAHLLGGKEAVDRYILKIAALFGLSSIDEFFAHYKNILSSGKSDWLDQWKEDKELVELDAAMAISPYKRQWREMVDERLFGFPLSQRRTELRNLTEVKGVPHKDFADRNIMIEWDFVANKPLIKEGAAEPRLILIDWEWVGD